MHPTYRPYYHPNRRHPLTMLHRQFFAFLDRAIQSFDFGSILKKYKLNGHYSDELFSFARRADRSTLRFMMNRTHNFEPYGF